jgi:hypothetical protein
MKRDFADVLMKYLDRSRRISTRKPFREKRQAGRTYLTDDELGPLGLAAYNTPRAIPVLISRACRFRRSTTSRAS